MSTQKSRLDTARVCTDFLVETIISCHLVRRIAYHLFEAFPEHFAVPWYNTALAPMLKDHADAAAVRMSETLSGEGLCKSCRAKGGRQKGCASTTCGKGLVDGLGLRGLEDLKNHRHVVSHPIHWHLTHPKVRKFVDDDRHYADSRPALIWDVHRSIVDAQVAAGASTTVIDVQVGGREVAVLGSILRLCWRGPAISDDILITLMAKAWMKVGPREPELVISRPRLERREVAGAYPSADRVRMGAEDVGELAHREELRRIPTLRPQRRARPSSGRPNRSAGPDVGTCAGFGNRSEAGLPPTIMGRSHLRRCPSE